MMNVTSPTVGTTCVITFARAVNLYARVKIEKIYVNNLGTTIYVMDSGQLLGRNEFDVVN